MKLSAQTARDLREGDVLRDHVVSGLELWAKKSGKFWFLYYRNAAGERRRPKLGEYPAIPLDKARELAKGWLQEVAKGNDPGADRAAYRAAPRVSDLIAEYLKLSETRDKPRTYEEKARRARVHINPHELASKKVVDVTLADVNAFLAHAAEKRLIAREGKKPLTLGGRTCARHLRDFLSGCFDLAEHSDYKWRERGTNPVIDSLVFRPRKRRRHMQGDEWARIAEQLDIAQPEYPKRVAAIRVALLAGTRITELITAKRSQLHGNQLVLAEHKTERTGDDRVIYLPQQALDIIATLTDDGSGLIFGPMTRYDIRTVWERVRERAGCPDLRAQDLRRTFASAAKSAGKGLDVIGELFGHKDPGTTRSYAWLFDEAATKAAQETANEISKRMGGNG